MCCLLQYVTSFIVYTRGICQSYKHTVLLLQGYLRALGMPRTAQVKRDARIGEAEARRDAGIKVRHHLIIPVMLA